MGFHSLSTFDLLRVPCSFTFLQQLARYELEKPYHCSIDLKPEEEHLRINLEYEWQPVTVRDIRGHTDQLDLDRDGAHYLTHDTLFATKRDGKATVEEYIKEHAQLVKDMLRADMCFYYSWRVCSLMSYSVSLHRWLTSARPFYQVPFCWPHHKPSFRGGYRASGNASRWYVVPVKDQCVLIMSLRSDKIWRIPTHKGASYRGRTSEVSQRSLASHNHQVRNTSFFKTAGFHERFVDRADSVWRSLNNPVYNDALAICDPFSIAYDKDLSAADRVSHEYAGEIQYVHQSPGQKWYSQRSSSVHEL